MKNALIFEEAEAVQYLEALIKKAVANAVLEIRQEEATKDKEEDNWIDAIAAMKILGIKSKTTLQDLRDVHAIMYSQPAKKIIRYYKPSLLKYLENNIVKY